jgi:hypothetical protein
MAARPDRQLQPLPGQPFTRRSPQLPRHFGPIVARTGTRITFLLSAPVIASVDRPTPAAAVHENRH